MARAAVRSGLILLSSMMLAACAASESGDARSPENTGTFEQTHREKAKEAGDLNVEQLASGAPGQGPERPQVLLAPSASALSRLAGVKAPDAGGGTYVAAFWAEKPTGGYSLEVRSARADENRTVLRLALKEPPPDAVLTQALTYPYAVAVVRNDDLAAREILLEDQAGRGLDWPVRSPGTGG